MLLADTTCCETSQKLQQAADAISTEWGLGNGSVELVRLLLHGGRSISSDQTERAAAALLRWRCGVSSGGLTTPGLKRGGVRGGMEQDMVQVARLAAALRRAQLKIREQRNGSGREEGGVGATELILDSTLQVGSRGAALGWVWDGIFSYLG